MLLALLAGAVPLAQAATIEHWWNVSYTTANPDGLFERRVIGVNGSWPPPPLEATQGDVHLIHFYNGLGDDKVGTSLHAHGMFFNGSNYYDGAVGVTQCPVPNGHTLDYYIDTSLNPGTYWVHSHYSGQYVDGLRTTSVVHPKTPRSDNVTWDDEYIIAVADWYHRQHEDLIKNEFLNWRNPTGAEPVPDSCLTFVTHNNTVMGDIGSGNGTSAGPLNNAKIYFEPGKTYRLRFVNMAAFAMFYIALDGHDWQVIEIDGVEVTPYQIDILNIAVAQRYSMLVKANNATNQNYAMMIMQQTGMYDTVPDNLVVNNTVQVVYSDANADEPEVIYEDWGPVQDDIWFKPLDQQASAPADVEYTLNFLFNTFDDGTNRASFSLDGGFQNITYQQPKVPSIFTAMSMGNDSYDANIYGAMTNAITLEHMQNVQLTVYNWDTNHHPFHLHGNQFQVIEKSFNVTTDDPEQNPPIEDLQANPARRDTITIPPSGRVVLRFRADNPGAWFFHCHIDWHLSSGLAVTFIDSPAQMQTGLQIPQEMYDHCKFFNVPTTGNVVGLNSTTDFKGQPWGPFNVRMGWTPKAIGAMAGCVLSFLTGLATIIWYGTGELNEEELEEEVRLQVEAKQNKKPLWKKVIKSRQQA